MSQHKISCAAALASLCVARVSAAAGSYEHTCHVDGFETPGTCVTLDVPRDYDRPEAGTLALTAVVIPASTGRPAPDPMILLAGGPGQSATSLAGPLSALLTNVRRERDVILFDVRGTGLSEPLECPKLVARTVSDSRVAAGRGAFELLRAQAAECARELGANALHHTSREVIEDIERFRVARGYEQIDLWGGSYGTRIAQHYVRAYGAHVRAVVLDAVTPVGTSVLVTGAHTPDVALAKLFDACAADRACAAAFPDLSEQLARLLRAVSEAPIVAPAVDPVNGFPGLFEMDYSRLANTLRVALYARPTTEILPLAIDAAAHGNYSPLLGLFGAAGNDRSVALGAQFSMLCAEDWPQAREAGSDARTGALMRDAYYDFFNRACEVWSRESLPETMEKAFVSSVPALAISGDFDPVTPPPLAEQALAQFTTSVHLIVPHGFHTNSANPCVAQIIASFLADPAAGGRDHACIAANPRLSFNTSPSS